MIISVNGQNHMKNKDEFHLTFKLWNRGICGGLGLGFI